MTPRICLIVDNPLRDLDGLVLLAWQLAQRGAEAWLVPMYEQVFDVRDVDADFVLLNYVRANNLDHLKAYLRDGIRVGVLDTEGTGGKTADEFAQLVGKSGGAGLVDLYCVWGSGQFAALEKHRIVAPERLRLTGCPRYDYCAPEWRSALPRPTIEPGYVLVNTNFPVVNPRFSTGPEGERQTMIQAGFPPEFAQTYIRDAHLAHRGMLDLMDELMRKHPSRRFVLRPHPFESSAPYLPLKAHANFELRQEGTSVEWLNQAAALLHLNCSTAVEAAMLGKPALSPAWLDTPALNVPGPHRMSRHAASPEELDSMLAGVLQEAAAGSSAAPQANLAEALAETYHSIDGKASARAADAILESLHVPPAPRAEFAPSWRSTAIQVLRRTLGYRLSNGLGEFARPSRPVPREQKLFAITQVRAIVDRLQTCALQGGAFGAFGAVGVEVAAAAPSRRASGRSIRLTRSHA